ncbi:MAG: molecular chaperone DnaJ [Planctomycetota bacterium]|nr:MAG: molecular chaperone DnaJ [Planctomycetota bacterium]REK44179.1 MAG: molecular chaperone DnaJ [Planctomycetota bacterium]
MLMQRGDATVNGEDLYEILGVSKDASEAEIQRAYRKLALKYHPDKNPNDKAAADRFKKVSEAFEVLSDREKRQAYDRRGMAGVHAKGFHGFESNEEIYSHFGDIFGDIFGGGMGGGFRGRPAGPQHGRDLRFRMSIPFAEAALGSTREVEIPVLDMCPDCNGSGMAAKAATKVCPDCGGSGSVTQQNEERGGYFSFSSACPACGGSGLKNGPPCVKCDGNGRLEKTRQISVKVPAGVENGQTLRLVGQGESGLRGGPNGDLLIEINVQPHPTYRRDGLDIRSDVRVPVATALLGGKVDVSTLHGMATLTIPPGTSSDQTFRLRGQGIRSGKLCGDHLARAVVTVPKELSDKAKEAVRKHLVSTDIS